MTGSVTWARALAPVMGSWLSVWAASRRRLAVKPICRSAGRLVSRLPIPKSRVSLMLVSALRRPGELNERLCGVWEAGAIGAVSEAEVRDSIARILRLDDARANAFLADIWTEYLGTLK